MLAASRIDQVSLECRNSHVPLRLLRLLAGKDVLVGAIDVATDAVETPDEVAAVIEDAAEHVPAGAPVSLHQLRHGADAARRGGGETAWHWRRARRWHGGAWECEGRQGAPPLYKCDCAVVLGPLVRH